jgi:hypothetical protein
MNKTHRLLPLLALSLVAISCGCPVSGLFRPWGDARGIKASDTVISETREVSGFSAIDMRGIGRIILTQGETESLEIRGSDNLVPLVMTEVRSGVLVIDMKEKIIINDPTPENVITITIGLKDLTSLSVSGISDVLMDGLVTPRLSLDISGTGQIDLSGLELEDLKLGLSGLGNVKLAGTASSAAISLSGAGNVEAGDLQLETAQITLTGLGNATLWVTEHLEGDITGAGNVEYYGDPTTDFDNTGLGHFESLGDK